MNLVRPLTLLALLTSGLLGRAVAEPEAAPLDLTQARVLASPGWPSALRSLLPIDREVEPLAPPLPPGPLLLLGLAGDPTAQALGEALLGVGRERLRGGYVIAGWKDRDRAIVFVLAEDAAALAAARIELETYTATQGRSPPPSLEQGPPGERGGVRVARGVTPRFRVRGATGFGPGESVLDIANAHGNRLWLGEGVDERALARMREHGIVPVAAAQLLWGGTPMGMKTYPPGRYPDRPAVEAATEALLAWQARGVRHFALDFGYVGVMLNEFDAAPGLEAEAARQVADRLRPGGLVELLVIPSSLASDLTDIGPPPDLRSIPEAVLGWQGPVEAPTTISRADAARAAKEAGVPLVLVETWASAAPEAIPSLPRGRDADLGDVLEGVLVRAGPGSANALAATWQQPLTVGPWPELAELLAACALRTPDTKSFLTSTGRTLELALAGRPVAPPWLRALPERLRLTAENLPPQNELLLAAWLPEPVVIDGRLDDPAWTHARPLALGRGTLQALSDGRRLVIGVRVPAAPDENAGATMWVPTRGGTALLGAHAGTTYADDWHTEAADTLRGGFFEGEASFDRSSLRGDPYPTRLLRLYVSLWNKSGSMEFGRPNAPGQVLVVR